MKVEDEGTFLASTGDPDEAWRLAIDYAKTMTAMGVKGPLIGAKRVTRHLYYVLYYPPE